ncbi:MAG: hypothetical protein HC799_19525 [Limnothrix sp. RL_2_0]|nr:hypothetical protein [Limnothrix sp. RL_2_0]
MSILANLDVGSPNLQMRPPTSQAIAQQQLSQHCSVPYSQLPKCSTARYQQKAKTFSGCTFFYVTTERPHPGNAALASTPAKRCQQTS